ncbi:MAG: hypothetical protein H0U40_00560 [Chloroflexia bacterium]|nr:hypothetical protein [Chloroflexia bacterium]MDQ3512041.1 hypothetical protein [Chloroflexota bacterium]
MHAYVQVVAQHRLYPSRLLVRCAEGSFGLWFGDDPTAAIEAIDDGLAAHLESAHVVRPLPAPHLWFHLSDLPLVPAQAPRPLPGR